MTGTRMQRKTPAAMHSRPFGLIGRRIVAPFMTVLVCLLSSPWVSSLAVYASGDGAGAQKGTLAEQWHHKWAWLLGVFLDPVRDLSPDLHHGEFILMVILIVVGLSLFFYQNSKNLKLIPQGRLQAALELLYEGLDGFIIGIIGAAGKIYVPFVGTIFIFILTMNWVGLIPGFMSPTSNLNVTVTMAVTTVLLVQLISIKELGLKDYLLHLCGEPLWLAPLMFPIHLVGELVAKPMSLAFRLFGNVFGEDQVIINLAALGLGIMLATWVPIPLQFPLLAFAVFTSFVQAFVFALLTAIYIVLFIGEHDAHHGEHHGEAH